MRRVVIEISFMLKRGMYEKVIIYFIKRNMSVEKRLLIIFKS